MSQVHDSHIRIAQRFAEIFERAAGAAYGHAPEPPERSTPPAEDWPEWHWPEGGER